jgi:Icc-related predicted phosphoesterase
MIPVGSRAVRKLIEKYQPLISLHCDIPGARGQDTKIGKATCYSVGSEYGEALLRGVIIKIDEKNVKRLFVCG